jgi:hypothetical protein
MLVVTPQTNNATGVFPYNLLQRHEAAGDECPNLNPGE